MSRVFSVIVLLLLAVALHTAGHILFGRPAGFRAFLFLVGPLRLERVRQKWSLRFNRRPAQWYPHVLIAPTDLSNLRRRTLRMVAGGPFTNVAAGILCLLLGILTGPPIRSGQLAAEFLPFWLVMFGAASVMVGVVTLVPGRSLGFDNDGSRILRLLRGSDEVDGEVALLALVGLCADGQRPRSWDPWLVNQALLLNPASPLGVFSRRLAYAHALDGDDRETARHHLEEALAHRELLPRFLQPVLLAQAAYFLSIYAGDAPRARSLLNEIESDGIALPHQITLGTAAVFYAEGKTSRAAALLERAEEEWDSAPDDGLDRADFDWIQDLKTRIVST